MFNYLVKGRTNKIFISCVIISISGSISYDANKKMRSFVLQKITQVITTSIDDISLSVSFWNRDKVNVKRHMVINSKI